MKKRRSDGEWLVGRLELSKDSYICVKYHKEERGGKAGKLERERWENSRNKVIDKVKGKWVIGSRTTEKGSDSSSAQAK